MLIEDYITDERSRLLALLTYVLVIDRLPFHLLKVDVAARVDCSGTSDEVNAAISPEYHSVSPIELDSRNRVLLFIF